MIEMTLAILLFFQTQTRAKTAVPQTPQDLQKKVQELLTSCERADKDVREIHAKLLTKLEKLRGLQFRGNIETARAERDKFGETATQFEEMRQWLDKQSKRLLGEVVKLASGTQQNRILSQGLAQFRKTLQSFIVPEDADEVFLIVNQRVVEAEKQAEKKDK